MTIDSSTYIGPETRGLVDLADDTLCVDCRGKILDARIADVLLLLAAQQDLLDAQRRTAQGEVDRLAERDRQRELAAAVTAARPPATWRNLWGWL